MKLIRLDVMDETSSEAVRELLEQGWTAFRMVVAGAKYNQPTPLHIWCSETMAPEDWSNLNGYGYLDGMTHKFFAFRRPVDAVAFRLRWGVPS